MYETSPNEVQKIKLTKYSFFTTKLPQFLSINSVQIWSWS